MSRVISSGIGVQSMALQVLLARKEIDFDAMIFCLSAGLPVPPKSSCWFCPYHKLSVWQEMRQDQPELFWKAVDLEKFINARRASLNLDPVWLTRLLKPLDQATHEYGQNSLFDDTFDACESGYCMV